MEFFGIFVNSCDYISRDPLTNHYKVKYYLETNSLRKFNSNLKNLKDISFTSALSIFELLSGIRERDFHIRKSVIENVFKSEIKIIWLFPEEITVNAFPGMEFKEERISGLKTLCKYLIESNTLNAFLKKASKGRFNLEFFRNLDAHYSNTFIEATRIGNKNLKEIIANQNEDYLIDFSKNYLNSLPSNYALNNSITLYVISNRLKDALELSSGESIDDKKIYENYNGNINIYISIFNIYCAKEC